MNITEKLIGNIPNVVITYKYGMGHDLLNVYLMMLKHSI